MRALYVLVLLALLIPQSALAAAPQVPGYVAVIARDNGGAAQLVRLTEIERAPRQRSESATRNWGVAVYDVGNRVLWQTHVVNPLNTTGRTVEAGAPIAGLTFANLPGAVRAALLDPTGNALLQINLGAQERSTARKNGEHLHRRMLEAAISTTTLSRGAADAGDESTRGSALKQVDYNMRQRDRLPRCNDAAPVIPEEASMRALTRSPECAGSPGALAEDPAAPLARETPGKSSPQRKLGSMSLSEMDSGFRWNDENGVFPGVPVARHAAQTLPAVPADKQTIANRVEAKGDESVETSELDLVNATLVFQGASGEAVTGPFTVMRHLSNGREHHFTVDAMGTATIPVERSKLIVLFVYPPASWLWGQSFPEPIAQDTDFTLVITLVKAVPFDVRLMLPTADAPDFDFFSVWIHNNKCCGHFWSESSILTGPDYRMVVDVPKNEILYISVAPSRPFLGTSPLQIGPFTDAANISVPIRRGTLLQGRIFSNGSLVTEGVPSIFMQTLEDGISFNFDSPITGAFDGTYRVSVEPLSDKVVLQAYQSGFSPSLPMVTTLDQDRIIDFELEPLNPVSIHAVDVDGNPVGLASVRIYRDGLLYSSTRTSYEGRVTTKLPAGSFEIRLFPDGHASEGLAIYDAQTFLLFGQPAATQVIEVPKNASLETEIIANDIFRFSVSVPREFGLGCNDSSLLASVELLDETGVVARSSTRLLSHVSDGHYVFDVISGPGRYKLRVSAVGGVVYESVFFDADSDANLALTRVGTGKLTVWEGVLRRHDGIPVADALVRPYDASGADMAAWCIFAAPRGGFKVLACDKCTYRFTSRSIDEGQGRTITLDDAVSGRTSEVFLDPPLEISQVSPDQVKQIHGQVDAVDRYDILFIAEGYTNIRETFTDTNGNGVWDGVQHFDSNGNGLYDGYDRIALYGSAPFPAENTDPTANNEPFTDLNGDGVLSINDEALYQRNVSDYLSALFSNDFYSEYRNAFRVHAALPFSNQVGVDFDGVMERDTRFGAFANRGGFLGADFSSLIEYAAEVLPDYDALVVMVNQEIPTWRVNSFVMATGGVLVSDLNDLVGAHEFGHKIATLGDEYTELGLEYVEQSLLRSNTTGFTQFDLVPWSRHIDLSNSIPTKDNFPGTGLFEGGNYYETSVYRPSMNSLMRFLSPGVFNVPSRFRMEAAISPFLHGLPGRLVLRGSAPRCGRAAKLDLSWDATEYGVSNVVIRSGSARGYVVGRGGASGSIRLPVSKAGRDDLFLIDADLGTVIDIESIPRSRPLSCSPGPD